MCFRNLFLLLLTSHARFNFSWILALLNISLYALTMFLYFSKFTMSKKPSLCFLLILDILVRSSLPVHTDLAFDFQGCFQGSLSQSRIVCSGVQRVKQSLQKAYFTNILPPVSSNVVCEAKSLYVKVLAILSTDFPFEIA